MPVTQVTQSNITVFKTPCNIDLTALSGVKLNHPDPAVREEASNLMNQAFAIQAEVAAMTERLKAETLFELEERHVALLMEHGELNKELEALKLRKYEFDGEAPRINGRAHKAKVALETHRNSKKGWVEMFVLPAQRQAYEVKERELLTALEPIRAEQQELQAQIDAWQEDMSKVAYQLRCKLAEVELTWNKLQRARGVEGAILDKETGLADRFGGYSGPILNR